MNAPERTACFVLDEETNEQKIVYSSDTKVANAGTFRINKEDHTAGNLLRMQLLRDPNVRFAGYYHPHPLVYYLNMRIQTNNSTVAPVEVLSSAIEDLANETDHLITQFQDSMESWKRENEDAINIGGGTTTTGGTGTGTAGGGGGGDHTGDGGGIGTSEGF